MDGSAANFFNTRCNSERNRCKEEGGGKDQPFRIMACRPGFMLPASAPEFADVDEAEDEDDAEPLPPALSLVAPGASEDEEDEDDIDDAADEDDEDDAAAGAEEGNVARYESCEKALTGVMASASARRATHSTKDGKESTKASTFSSRERFTATSTARRESNTPAFSRVLVVVWSAAASASEAKDDDEEVEEDDDAADEKEEGDSGPAADDAPPPVAAAGPVASGAPAAATAPALEAAEAAEEAPPMSCTWTSSFSSAAGHKPIVLTAFIPAAGTGTSATPPPTPPPAALAAAAAPAPAFCLLSNA